MEFNDEKDYEIEIKDPSSISFLNSVCFACGATNTLKMTAFDMTNKKCDMVCDKCYVSFEYSAKEKMKN
jgi:hypothetical protein